MKKTIAPILLATFLTGCATDTVPVESSATAPANNATTATTQAPKEGDDFMDARWAEARGNVKWVFDDAGARSTFQDCMAGKTSIEKGPGSDRYKCVLYAQGHNPNAQNTIRVYGPVRTDRYIAALGR